MRFRFTLSHSVIGSLEISEPDGWLDTVLKLERHEDYHSLIEYFDGDFVFYGQTDEFNGGIDFIRQVEISYGADAELGITIEIAPDDYTFQTVFIGQLDLWNAEELSDNKMKIPIIRNDFWAKFINRLDTPVDIQSDTTLDDTQADVFNEINLSLIGQTLRSKYLSEEVDGEMSEFPGVGYYQLTPNAITLSEIEETFSPLFSFNPALPVWWLEAKYAGTYVFDIRIEISQLVNVLGNEVLTELVSGGLTAPTTFVLSRNGDSPISFTRIDNAGTYDGTDVYSCWDTPPAVSALGTTIFTLSTTLQLQENDIIRVYLERTSGADNVKAFLWGQNGVPCLDASFQSKFVQSGRPDGMAERPTYFSVVADTVYPSTNAFAFLLHDVAGQITDRIIGEDQVFYSELFGSPQTIYRQYVSDGCRWANALIKGLQIRQYSLVEKRFFQSFKQWWEGANPIFNLGLGYETIAEQEVIRVEDKRHFYDEEVSLNIDYVRDIVRSYDDNRVFKSVKIGYKKWQSEDIAGIDDAQTKHTYASILKKGGKDITLESEFIAASLAIETTRRKTREKSADYKFDNDTFIIALNPVPTSVSPDTSPEVTDYLPELDENFTFIENLLNADTRYNSRLTPARNFMRWRDWLSGCLQAYPLSAFKFTAAEGNYDMTSDLAEVSDGCEEYHVGLSEKEDIPVSTNPFHLALLYEITIPLDWDDYVTIRDNRKKAIGISQTNENHVKFFIKELNYKVVEGEATIQAWPIELMSIKVIESVTPQLLCESLTPCEDAYLTELLDELITEDGDCLILN